MSVHGAHILLVEDDEALRVLIARNLIIRHHVVSIAVDAAHALKHLRTHTFDLIILDINLPDQSGWDVLRIASHEGCLQPVYVDEQHEKLPVVVVSAVRVSPRRLTEFRPLAYLPKPFPMDALLRLAVEAAERKDGYYLPATDVEWGTTDGAVLSPLRKDLAAELASASEKRTKEDYDESATA